MATQGGYRRAKNVRADDLLRDTLWGEWWTVRTLANEYQHAFGGSYESGRRAVNRWLADNPGLYTKRTVVAGEMRNGGMRTMGMIFLHGPY